MMVEGDWTAAKHGGNGKRGWKKLHLGIDATGVIVAQIVIDGHADDAATVPQLLDQIDGNISLFVADTRNWRLAWTRIRGRRHYSSR